MYKEDVGSVGREQFLCWKHLIGNLVVCLAGVLYIFSGFSNVPLKLFCARERVQWEEPDRKSVV